MGAWFIATQQFSRRDDEKWERYVASSGLTQLEEVVSLDGMLCPTLLREIKVEYWPHIVNENFMLHFFTDFEFLMQQVESIPAKNVLCVFRNPAHQPQPPHADFRFLGYDLVDVQGGVSALTNCGGFPNAFANSEINAFGLLPDLERAVAVRKALRTLNAAERHAYCDVWAIFRLSRT